MEIVIRDWTFTHWWVRPVVNTWFGIYHKTIVYSGVENIDWQKPIIFAPSHRNAFSDALCLILPTSYTSKKFIYPLIRADAFGQNRFIDWVLTSFHMVPVYRPRDKVNLKQQNTSVFNQCYDILEKKGNLLIHPEGNCIPRKKVRRFKKGLARIALGAEAKHDFNLGVVVIPVGINYRSILQPRQGIHVQYGAPISVTDFKRTYQKHTARGISKLTKTVQKGVKAVTVHTASNPFYDLYEDHFTLNHQFYNPRKGYDRNELQSNQAIARSLNHPADDDTLQQTKEKVSSLKKYLIQHELRIDQPLKSSRSLPGLVTEGVINLILLPFILYGWINNFLPWKGIHKIADKVEEKQFKSSARMASGLLLFPLCFVLQTTAVAILSDSWIWSLLYFISVPLTGILALNGWEHILSWKQCLRLNYATNKTKSEIYHRIKEILKGR